MQATSILAVAKIFSSLTMLTYASWSDYKTREVSNRVWIFFAPTAFALTFTELFLSDLSLLPRAQHMLYVFKTNSTTST